MNMDPHEVQQIDEGIFTIFSVFGRGESVDIIARAESIGPLGGLCADAKWPSNDDGDSQ